MYLSSKSIPIHCDDNTTALFQITLTLYRTVVTIRTASLTYTNYTFCPHSVFMCFVWISGQTAIISIFLH